jgi:hypothetical protein
VRHSCSSAQADHARRSNYATRVFRPAANGVHPAENAAAATTANPGVYCSSEPFPGIPVPAAGIYQARAEQLAECSWAGLITGPTPQGLRHGHVDDEQ